MWDGGGQSGGGGPGGRSEKTVGLWQRVLFCMECPPFLSPSFPLSKQSESVYVTLMSVTIDMA